MASDSIERVHVHASGSFWPPSLLDADTDAYEQIIKLCDGDPEKAREYTSASSESIVEVLRLHWNATAGIEMRSEVARVFADHLDARSRRSPSDVRKDPHSADPETLRAALIGCAYEVLLRRVGTLHLPVDPEEARRRIDGVLGPLVLSQCRSELAGARERVMTAAGVPMPARETATPERSNIHLSLLAHAIANGQWPGGVSPADCRLIAHDPRTLAFLLPAGLTAGALVYHYGTPDTLIQETAQYNDALKVAACVLAPAGLVHAAAYADIFTRHGVNGPTILDHIYMSPPLSTPPAVDPAQTPKKNGKRGLETGESAASKRPRKKKERIPSPTPNHQALTELRGALSAEPHCIIMDEDKLLFHLQSNTFDELVRVMYLDDTKPDDPLSGAHITGIGTTPPIGRVVARVLTDADAMNDVHALSAEKGRGHAAVGLALERIVRPFAEHPWSALCAVSACSKGKQPTTARIMRMCAHIMSTPPSSSAQ